MAGDDLTLGTVRARVFAALSDPGDETAAMVRTHNRSLRALNALMAYEPGGAAEPVEDVIVDLLTDLRHLAKGTASDWDDLMERSLTQFVDEDVED